MNSEFIHNKINLRHFQPQLPAEAECVDYDSADSAVSDLDDDEDEEDVFEGTATSTNPKAPDRENTEHSNPSSYSWCVMRLAIMKLVQHQLQDFLGVAGIEMQGEEIQVHLPYDRDLISFFQFFFCCCSLYLFVCVFIYLFM
jgi:hypothetical protein